MSGKAIGTSLGYGYEGNVSRNGLYLIESRPVALDSEAIFFGQPVVVNADDTYSSVASVVLTAANFGGVAVAEVKQATTYPLDGTVTNGSYLAGQACDMIKEGVVSVKCQRGTPTRGGSVYVRKTLSTNYPDAVVGGFEAEADEENVLLTNCTWNTNRVDGNNITELLIKTINI